MKEIPNADRVDLTVLFQKRGYKMIVEVGTEQGVFAETICKNNPDALLICVDAWQATKGYREHVSQAKLDAFMEITKERLKGYHVALMKAYSVDAAQEFGDESLDAVYIDANHDFTNVVADISAWYPKLKRGGIISGHDYTRKKGLNYGVIEAVEGYTRANGIPEYYVLGRKERVEGEKRDRSRSWYWIKP